MEAGPRNLAADSYGVNTQRREIKSSDLVRVTAETLFWYSVNRIWIVWNVVFSGQYSYGIFIDIRCADGGDHGIADDYENQRGSTPWRYRKLPGRKLDWGAGKLTYSAVLPSAVPGILFRCDPSHLTYCGETVALIPYRWQAKAKFLKVNAESKASSVRQ